MRWKALLLIGLAVGYVLGTRAGRENYERLVSTGRQLWHSPQAEEVREEMAARLDEASTQAAHFVKEKTPLGD